MDLEFPEIDAAAASPAAIALVEPAASVAVPKPTLKALALAEFADCEKQIADSEVTLKDVVHDLSTPTKLADAISLRNRLVKKPLAVVRSTSTAIKSKLDQVAKDVTVREGELIADFARVEQHITPQIEKRQDEIEQERLREEARKKKHTDGIAAISAMLAGAEEKSADRLAKGVEIVDGLLVTGFEEYQADAEATRTRVLLSLKAMHQKAVDREAEEARRLAEQERLARVAAEQAEAARLLAEQRAELDRERAELAAMRAQMAPPPVPPAPAPEPAPAPVEPVVQDPPRVFDRAAGHVPPQIAEDDAPGLELDSGEFVPASQLNAQPAAPATRRTLVEADVAALVDHVMSAFTGTKFPTQPKPGTAWWADTLAHCRKLQQQIGAAA